MTTTPTTPLAAPVAPAADPPAEKAGFNLGRAIAWTFMVLVILVSLFPFYWRLRTALSSNNALYAGSDSLLPVQMSGGGFARVFGLQTGQAAIDAGGAGQPISFWHMLMTPFAIFFLRQFFLGISREVEEAALVEGASKVRVFFRLILPMSTAPIATLGILTYITAWNDYFWPLMVSYTDRSRVLTVALGAFKSQTPQTGPDWSG